MAAQIEYEPRAYETVAASQTGQVMGGTGSKGDAIESILIIPETTSPGAVTLIDGGTSIIIFVGGASSVSTLTPIVIWLNTKSVSGPWSITTGTAVHVIAFGKFGA